jgi:ELWxxDGT repeat protein
VSVKLLGEPRPAEPGKPFQGEIQIVAGNEALVSGFRFERALLADGSLGAGPQVLSFDAPVTKQLAADESMIVKFEVLQDPEEPLVFVFEFDDHTVARQFDLSPEHFKLMTEGAPLIKEVDFGGEKITSQPDRSEIVAEEEAEEIESASITRIIQVSGQLAYVREGRCIDTDFDYAADVCSDLWTTTCGHCSVTTTIGCVLQGHCPDGETCVNDCPESLVGADAVTFHVKDDNAGPDTTYITDRTDEHGAFNVYIEASGNPDLYVEFEALNGVVAVRAVTWGSNNYKWKAPTHNDYSGTHLALGTLIASTMSGALEIHTSITRAARWYYEAEGQWTPRVVVRWPDISGHDVSYYSPAEEEIFLKGGAAWNARTQVHEWGHHWTQRYARIAWPDTCNGVCDPGSGDMCAGHCLWCEESGRVAWSEGWPNWLADAVSRSYRARYNVLPMILAGSDIESAPDEPGCGDCICPPYETEGYLSALLRDIQDAGYDSMSVSAVVPAGPSGRRVLRFLRHPPPHPEYFPGLKPNTAVSVRLSATTSGFLPRLTISCAAEDGDIEPGECDNIIVEDTDGDGELSIDKYVIPAGAYRVDALVEGMSSTSGAFTIQFDDYDDAGGDDIPDELALGTDEIFAVTRLDRPTTPAQFLTDFQNRYPGHLPGLWSTATNLGYFIADAVSPGAPSSLTSTSHPVGDPSSNPAVTFTWSPAPDDVSGVGGYSWSLSQSGPALPDTTAEIGRVTSFTTADLAPGSYHFNLRAVDRAGNWASTYESYGPVEVLPPCNITVTEPESGAVWRIGEIRTISWTCARDTDLYGWEPVQLELYRGDVYQRGLGISSSSSTSWEIFPNVSPASDYRVKITSRDWADDTSFSSGFFTIESDLIDNGDGTVSHWNSCLMWLQDTGTAGSTMTWETAAAWARDLDFAGHTDWRLPSGRDPDGSVCDSSSSGGNCVSTEMGTLYHRRLISALAPGPFAMPYWQFWTSTQQPADASRAMAQDMLDGGQFDTPKNGYKGPWAVRAIPGCTPIYANFVVRPDADGDGFVSGDDCDDSQASVSPIEPEVCGDGIDNDCNGAVDEFCNCGDGLVDNGDGTVTESSTCLMWVKDFRQAGFGQYSWQGAIDLAGSFAFAGYDDWRLPETLVPDATCDWTPARGYNCTGSEMGHLHYVTLGNLATQLPACTGPFVNYGDGWSSRVWSGTEDSLDPARAYYFMFDATDLSGVQDTISKQVDIWGALGCGVVPVRVDQDCLGDTDGDGYRRGVDCDDTDGEVYPGAWELCDGKDNDCDGFVDEDSAIEQSCSAGIGGCESSGILLCDTQSLGTRVLGDLQPGINGSYPAILGQAGGLLLFAANDGSSGSELWKTDGTRRGTVLLKEINSGSLGSGIFSLAAATVGSQVFFGADDGVNGRELWKSDGTTAGTTLVKNIYAGSGSSSPTRFTDVAGKLFFAATGSSTTGQELWVSDGTNPGTLMVQDIYLGSYTSNPDNLTAVGTTLFFAASDGTNGRELWRSDGTTAGTARVKDIATGIGSSNPKNFAVLNGTLFFQASNGSNGAELWKSDGTEAGTVMVKDIRSAGGGSRPSYMTVVNGLLYFSADDGVNGYELWRSDGTAAGTTMVKNIRSGSSGSYPYRITKVGNSVFFWADDGVHGMELWTSDGTAAGTVLVADIQPGSSSSDPTDTMEYNGTLIFSAYEVSLGNELWRSDGTQSGTILVKDIALAESGSYAHEYTPYDGRLFFVAEDLTNGVELWVTDGTEDGTACSAVPGSPTIEVCDDVDNDCNGDVDDSAVDAVSWWSDGDGDGYGAGVSFAACDAPAPYVTDGSDCEDSNAAVHPGAVEVGCDGLDNDCDPVTPEIFDADGDGLACDLDCDDSLPTCTTDCSDGNVNGIADCAELSGDADADGTLEPSDCDDTDPNNWVSCGTCVDADTDGFFVGCDAYVTIAGPDCDDSASTVYPWGWEVCDLIDNNCDGSTDEAPVLLSRLEDPNRTAAARFGSSVARIHDVDGDGTGDFIVGAPNDTVAGLSEAGSAIVFSGLTQRPIHVVTDPAPAQADHFGVRVAAIADVNGDSIDDILVGAYGDASDTGIAFVFSGSAAAGFALIRPLQDPTGAPGDLFGYSLSALGDVDGDTVPDILVGARGDDGNRGSATVFSGESGAALRQLTDPLGDANDYFGYATSGIGDVDGDGTPDMLVGAFGGDSPVATAPGVVIVFSGVDGSVVRRLYNSSGETGDDFGRAIANAGDLDGDLVDDIIVGAPRDDDPVLGVDAGSVTTFSGATGAKLAQTFDPEGEGDEWLGYGVASIGDVDGDAVPDLIVGALRDDTASGANVGSALVLSGASLAATSRLSYDLGALNEGFGVSVCGVDDLDGDGLPDILVGAYGADPASSQDSGRAYLFSSTLAQDTDGDGSGNLCDTDDDEDGYADTIDCSPQDGDTYTGAWEVNDGRDNQCDGDDGYGLIDEISGVTGFLDPGDKTRYSWTSQQGATMYEVARSAQPNFAICTTFATPDGFLIDTATPNQGEVFYYLARPVSPYEGSWGARSPDEERILSCGG